MRGCLAPLRRWWVRRGDTFRFNLFIWALAIALCTFAMWGRRMW